MRLPFFSYNTYSNLFSPGESAVKTPLMAGAKVTHSYELTNQGTTTLNNLQFLIDWPLQHDNKKWLLYFVDAVVQTTADGVELDCVIPKVILFSFIYILCCLLIKCYQWCWTWLWYIKGNLLNLYTFCLFLLCCLRTAYNDNLYYETLLDKNFNILFYK